MTYAQSLAWCNRFIGQTTDIALRLHWGLERMGLEDAQWCAVPRYHDPAYLRGFERGKAQLAMEQWCEEKGLDCDW